MRSSRALRAVLPLAGLALPAACTPLPEYVQPPVSPVPATAPLPAGLETIAVGERVRLQIRSGRGMHVLTGRVTTVDSATIRVSAGASDTFHIEQSRVMELWVSRGQRSRSSAAGVGLIFGGIAGGGVGYALGEDCNADGFVCFDRSDTSLAGALAGGVLGGTLGAVVGGGDRWKSVPLRGRAALRFTPERMRGSGLSLVRLEF